MRNFDSPFVEGEFIALPDAWLGSHVTRRDEAIGLSRDAKLATTHRTFAVAMALLDDWNIAELPHNPELWDFAGLDLRVIAWINTIVMDDFMACWKVPKVSWSQSQSGAIATQVTKADGNLEDKM